MRSGSENQLKRTSEKWDVEGILLQPDYQAGRIDLAGLFGNDRPVELEIGTGKGTFLLARATDRPEVNFIGIEYAKAYGMYAADRYKRHGLGNIRMVCDDAIKFIDVCIGDATLSRVHIYFPDPWPKRKHHRRRTIQRPFVRQLRRILKPGGQLLIKTDHRDYFEWMRRVLRDAEGFARTPFPQLVREEEQGMVGTNFERKYIEEGRSFYSMALLKYI
ncbi:MAG: tRNA (guanosine(46)-N7)-methyltransferase TrmB [Planctomycetota bacterium]